MGMHTALANLRVVEIGQGIFGPYCDKLLADLGADGDPPVLATWEPLQRARQLMAERPGAPVDAAAGA